MKVIAVSGWKGSGKDTIAEYLVKEKGYTRLGFADLLKDMVADQYSIPREWLDDQSKKEEPILTLPAKPEDMFSSKVHNIIGPELKYKDGTNYWTPRALCILEGSIKRSVQSNYWVQKVISNIKSSNNELFVIPDLRYRSEAKQLVDAFGEDLLTVRVNRFKESKSYDASEVDLDNYFFDVYIDNTRSVKDLYQEIEEKLK